MSTYGALVVEQTCCSDESTEGKLFVNIVVFRCHFVNVVWSKTIIPQKIHFLAVIRSPHVGSNV